MLHENSMFITEINLHIPQHDVYAKSSSPNGFKSIEGCIDKISNQIVKIVDQWKKTPIRLRSIIFPIVWSRFTKACNFRACKININ